MKVTRNGFFETNSSSTHSLSICTKEQFLKWKNNEIYYLHFSPKELGKEYDGKFVSREEFIAAVKEAYLAETGEMEEGELLEFAEEEGFIEVSTYESFGSEYETFEEFYTTPSGDEIVVFGYYGSDY
jgi:hypothetical protein